MIDQLERILRIYNAEVTHKSSTTAAGAATGMTLVDAALAALPNYTGQVVKILSGGATGQVRQIMSDIAGVITVDSPFTDAAGAVQQIGANTDFCIISRLVGGAGPLAPSIGLWMFGECDPGMIASANTIVCPNLAAFPDDIFNDEFWMQVIHNDNAPGTAPERQWRRITNYVGATGTFTTDNFGANVEANDLVAIVHESIMSIEILGFGTLTVSSATIPTDAARTEVNDYFKGCILMPTEGTVRFQPRPIRQFTAGGIFTLDEPFTQAPGLVDYIIIGAAYPVQRLIDIFNIVNALLVTTETGGTITTDGTAQDVYINDAPAGVFEPLKVMIDLSQMTVAETVVIRTYYRIRPAPATKKQKDEIVFQGVQSLPLKNIELEPNRYGIQVTLQCTIGGPIDFDWEVLYRV